MKWTYKFPEALDIDEGDEIITTVRMDEVSLFTKFDGTDTLTIEDLSSEDVFEGNFTLNVTLSDGKAQRNYGIILVVHPPISESILNFEELLQAVNVTNETTVSN